MEIDDSAALIYYTYYMVDWAKVSQKESQTQCLGCGRKMMDIEALRDKKGALFEGKVCHSCKTVVWSRGA